MTITEQLDRWILTRLEPKHHESFNKLTVFVDSAWFKVPIFILVLVGLGFWVWLS